MADVALFVEERREGKEDGKKERREGGWKGDGLWEGKGSGG